MKLKVIKYSLGFYDLFLASGAIILGIQMIQSKSQVFTEYPKEWLTKVPFTSWVVPGMIAIILFGMGNIVAAIVTFLSKSNKAWVLSGAMGSIFLLSLIAQLIVLGECYLATLQFFILGIMQLLLSLNVMRYSRKHEKYMCA